MQIQKINNNYYNKYNPVSFKQIIRNDIPEHLLRNNNYLLLVSGPSGVGKDTVMNKIIHKFNKIVTHTTRAKREGEIEGKSYFFTTAEKFLEGVKNNEFVEYVKSFSGNYYGTKRETIEKTLDKDKPALLIVDVDGANNIRKKLKDDPDINIVSIFIKPPSLEVLKSRLIKRGSETPEAIKERLERATYEMQQANEFSAEIQNNYCEESIKDIFELLHLS